MNKDKSYLGDVRSAMQNVVAYMGDLSCEAFMTDEKTMDAIHRKLEIMGEATKRLSIAIRESHPAIPWKMMAGMRDKLIHGYDDIESDVVYDTVTRVIPPLIPKIEAIILTLHDPE